VSIETTNDVPMLDGSIGEKDADRA
jgi:hypothetical protein